VTVHEDPYADVPLLDVAPWGEGILHDGVLRVVPPAANAAATEAPGTLVEQIRAKLTPGGLVLDVPDEVPAVWAKTTTSCGLKVRPS
jgi:hypothetical protein